MSEKLSQRINDDYKRATFILFAQMCMTLFLFIYEASLSRSIFSLWFLVKIALFIMLYRFYFQAQKNRDYAFWGITFLIGLYLFQIILHYTFIHYNAIVLYLSFLSTAFLGVSIYVMSSPLFFPRVQWWEYDFRYRGDIKILAQINDLEVEGRISDLRRECACVEFFEHFEPGTELKMDLVKSDQSFHLEGTLVTAKKSIPGRPYRYGMKLHTNESAIKKEYEQLKSVWNSSNKVKLRKKFDND
jgi:hypothetical protein